MIISVNKNLIFVSGKIYPCLEYFWSRMARNFLTPDRPILHAAPGSHPTPAGNYFSLNFSSSVSGGHTSSFWVAASTR
jgi:hypothetical protein